MTIQRQLLDARRLATITLVALGINSLACGYFNQDDADITYTEDFSFDLPVDADALCPEGQDCGGMAVMSPETRELDPFEFDIEIDIVKETGRDELAQYTGKFKSVNITKIEYTVSDNNLTFDLPPITIYLGPLGSETTDAEGVVAMATIPEISAATNVSDGQAQINAENAEAVSDLIKSLQTKAFASATPVIEEGELFPPTGKANIKATIYVTLVANPIDAIQN